MRARGLLLLFWALVAAPAAWAVNPPVDAVLQPTEISLGESARLTITVTSDSTLSVNLPTVPGLEFRVVGQSRQIQIINGVTLQNTSTIVRVTPENAGTYKIPGLNPGSAPLVLHVNPAGSGSNPNTQGSQGGSPSPGGAATNGIRLTPDGSAFVRVIMPKHEVYVGESIPVELELGTRDGFVVSINGIPKLSSSDFTLNNLSHQPERGGRLLDGQPFSILTWRSMLAAVKPGKFSLSFEAPLTVRIRTRPRNDSLLDDMLGDPFLQNIFGATVTKNVTVTSPENSFTVLPLPEQGRPADFGGAVGTFKIATDVSSPTNTEGDPLTLRMHVTGAGNFDRVESGMLPSGDPWKTYDPKATFKSLDAVGYHGEKTFEQPLIADKSGELTIPPLDFSYFDPEAHRYATVRSAPIHVKVAPSAAETAANGTPPPSAASSNAESMPGLKADHALTGARVSSLTPAYFQPGLGSIPAVLALLFSGAWLAQRRHERIASDLERLRERARLKLIEELEARMAAAAAGKDAALYLESARALLQQALGKRWGISPTEVTADDADTRLAQDPDRAAILRIFALADEASYSGGRVQTKDFERWSEIVKRQLSGGPQPDMAQREGAGVSAGDDREAS